MSPQRPHIRGEHVIYGMDSESSLIRLRIIASEVCLEIESGSNGSKTTGYLSVTEARTLAADLLTERGSERRRDRRFGTGVFLNGLYLKIDSATSRDSVIVDPQSPRTQRLSGLLLFMANEIAVS